MSAITPSKKGSKSVGYKVTPNVTYQATFSVYKSHADYKRNILTDVMVDCTISSEMGFYYEHTSDQSINYLGNSDTIEEAIGRLLLKIQSVILRFTC